MLARRVRSWSSLLWCSHGPELVTPRPSQHRRTVEEGNARRAPRRGRPCDRSPSMSHRARHPPCGGGTDRGHRHGLLLVGGTSPRRHARHRLPPSARGAPRQMLRVATPARGKAAPVHGRSFSSRQATTPARHVAQPEAGTTRPSRRGWPRQRTVTSANSVRKSVATARAHWTSRTTRIAVRGRSRMRRRCRPSGRAAVGLRRAGRGPGCGCPARAARDRSYESPSASRHGGRARGDVLSAVVAAHDCAAQLPRFVLGRFSPPDRRRCPVARTSSRRACGRSDRGRPRCS